MNFIKTTLLLSIFTIAIYANNINNSVVKIFATISKPDQLVPWQSKKSVSVTGSGVFIKNGYILTSAHVVHHATYIEVKKQNSVKKYQATIEYLSYDTDLALLKIDDSSFFSDMKPLNIGDLPNLQDEVRVVGYPKGGKDISITKGIISRIEYSRYALSNKEFLTIQIDAPINNGNSGGPALNNKNEIVGIAMQGLSKKSSEGIGYIVPPTVIKHFLKDIKDDTLDGTVGSGFYYSTMLNSSLQHYYASKSKKSKVIEESGILVTKVLKGTFIDGMLKEDDIILSIDDNLIENDGTIKIKNNIAVSFKYIIHSKQIGEIIKFTILRDGDIKELSVVIDKPNQLIKKEIKKPKYF
ncbi:MAG: trypsin-like peptidase domain-containing protein, partial [Campylobacterota bacterium]|nr:trypsin-like peptidase domain-containing protein [Campylobacterota bacterium]